MPIIAASSCVSPLFVPGDRPNRFEKAAASGADAIIIDLEDAVAPDKKAEARGHVKALKRLEHPGLRARQRAVHGNGTTTISARSATFPSTA